MFKISGGIGGRSIHIWLSNNSLKATKVKTVLQIILSPRSAFPKLNPSRFWNIEYTKQISSPAAFTPLSAQAPLGDGGPRGRLTRPEIRAHTRPAGAPGSPSPEARCSSSPATSSRQWAGLSAKPRRALRSTQMGATRCWCSSPGAQGLRPPPQCCLSGALLALPQEGYRAIHQLLWLRGTWPQSFLRNANHLITSD